MAVGSLGSLVVSLALDTARFQGDLGKAATLADRRMRAIKTTVVNSISGIAGAFALSGLIGFVRRAADAADQMKTLAERTGRTVESLSQLQYVAERGNTSIDSLIKAQDQLAKKMGATDEESKAVVKALDRIGLSAANLRTVSPDRQLDLIADAMGKVTNPTERARLALTLFGKSGAELLPILKDGAGGIRDLREEADRLGITVNTLTVDRLAKIDDKFQALTGQARGLKLELADLIAGPLLWMQEKFTMGIAGWNAILGNNLTRIEELNIAMQDLAAERKRLTESLDISGEDPTGHDPAAIKARIAEIDNLTAMLKEQQEAWLAMPRVMERYEADIARINAKNAEGADKFAGLGEVIVTAQRMLPGFSSAMQEMLDNTATDAQKAAEEYRKFRAELELLLASGVISAGEFNKRIDEFLDKSIPEVEVTAKKIDEHTKQIDRLSTYAEQAARNIQSHFADFLFDPFDKGIKGMLKGFIDVLRRMIAEASAARILEGLQGKMTGFLGSLFGGGSGGLGSLFGGGSKLKLPPGTVPTVGPLAGGGFIPPHGMSLVGERGPELAFAGNRGTTIVPFDKVRSDHGMSIVLNAPVSIDARGATQDAVKELYSKMPSVLRAHGEQIEARIIEGLRRNRYRLSGSPA